MAKDPILTNYVSAIDKLMETFDQEHPGLSLSQKKEKEKYARIYYLRDVEDRPDVSSKIWEDF